MHDTENRQKTKKIKKRLHGLKVLTVNIISISCLHPIVFQISENKSAENKLRFNLLLNSDWVAIR